jgi:hypothetical protein
MPVAVVAGVVHLLLVQMDQRARVAMVALVRRQPFLVHL